MNCKYCGASMRRQSSPNPNEVWFKCCNNKCQYEEFLNRNEVDKKIDAQKEQKKRDEGRGPVLCPKCNAKMSFDGSHSICMKCGKML